MNVWEEEKAQTGTEYIIMLAGAILVAIVVGLFLKSIPSQAQPKINQAANAAYHGF